jgi:DNA recombination protein RmuC
MLIPTLLVLAVVLLLAVIALQVLQLRRQVMIDLSPVQQMFAAVERTQERTERGVREEIARNREESATAVRGLTGDLRTELTGLRQSNEQKLDQIRQDALDASRAMREETTVALRNTGDGIAQRIGQFELVQKGHQDMFSQQLARLIDGNDQRLGSMRELIEQRLTLMQQENGQKVDQVRGETAASIQKVREEVSAALKQFNENISRTMELQGGSQRQQLTNVTEQLTRLTESNEKKLDELRNGVELKLKTLQEDNAKSLEQMRLTVDEKLQGTLEKRLGDSFKLVSERLEQVYKGLGEMQTLATGVGDLKKVLTNVKSRGTWGEVQLGTLLEQCLTPDQYSTNVSTKENDDRVEFVIKLPNRGEEDSPLLLPIDAKFPVEDYQRLVEAQEQADPEAAEAAARQLELRIKQCAREICTKYINPPLTTDFAILFLPTEGLFAEVIRRIGLPDYVQRECRVVIAGPTTLWSILNSLQMGFRTLAIQKRSSEVWSVLGAVKTEFAKYGDVLSKVQKKLQEASNTVDKAAVRTRAIERKLRGVQELPAAESEGVLMLPVEVDAAVADEVN